MLGVYKHPKLVETFKPQVINDTALLGCRFTASKDYHPNFIQPQWRKGSKHIMGSSRFEMPQCKWEGEQVTIKLIIKSVTSEDDGSYFCSIKYSTDIIKDEVTSNCGEIVLSTGN